MAYVDWEFKAREFGNCNCDYGCPCQFNALPTHGNCEAVVGFIFDEGHFGETRLEGLKAVFIGYWPGPIHLGEGQAQLIIDENANEDQRNALLTILSGGETAPGATVFNVFAGTFSTLHDPIFAEIEIEVDVDRRMGRILVEGHVDAVGEPIRNPVTGGEHRARINLPNGFEYTVAEVGSGTSKTHGAIALDLASSYGQFAHLHMTPNGPVR